MFKRASRAFKLIDKILWNDWDPIGVNEMSEARDEYHMYISAVVDLKIANSECEIIAQYLLQIETDRMGLPGNLENCRRVAQMIVKLVL